MKSGRTRRFTKKSLELNVLDANDVTSLEAFEPLIEDAANGLVSQEDVHQFNPGYQ